MVKDAHSVSIALLSYTYGVVKNIFMEQHLYEVNFGFNLDFSSLSLNSAFKERNCGLCHV